MSVLYYADRIIGPIKYNVNLYIFESMSLIILPRRRGSKISQRSAQTLWECAKLMFGQKFPENCMKMKKIRSGRVPKILLCRSTTASSTIQFPTGFFSMVQTELSD